MLPNLSRLTLDIESKRKGRDEAEDNALEALRKVHDGAIIGKEGDQKVLYSNNDDDLSALAVVLYSRHWDSVMNGFLAEKASSSDYRPEVNNIAMGITKYKHGFLMFVDPYAFYTAYMSDITGTPWEDLTYTVHVGRGCNMTTRAVPESLMEDLLGNDGEFHMLNEWQRERLYRLDVQVGEAMEKFNTDFTQENEVALNLYANVVQRMINTLEDLWRPWLAFYEDEARLKRIKRPKLQRQGLVTISAAPAQPSPSPPPPPRPKAQRRPPEPKRRIINSVPAIRNCAKTDKVIWVGLQVPESDVDFNKLSASMRSASLDFSVAMDFATGWNANGMESTTVFGLLLDADVPVISVLDILGNYGESFYCFAQECEVLIKDGCTYERLPGASFQEQVETMKTDYPSYHDALTKNENNLSRLLLEMNEQRSGWEPVFLSVGLP